MLPGADLCDRRARGGEQLAGLNSDICRRRLKHYQLAGLIDVANAPIRVRRQHVQPAIQRNLNDDSEELLLGNFLSIAPEPVASENSEAALLALIFRQRTNGGWIRLGAEENDVPWRRRRCRLWPEQVRIVTEEQLIDEIDFALSVRSCDIGRRRR
ncbi:MAG: hypothetical protein ACLQU1_18610 [Bryobacteraceae bacterium]